jgi:uncharacterized protein (TIGR02266 family)
MFQISSEETYQDGQIIFEEGSAGNLIYTIMDGAVELYKQVGAEKIVVGVLQPGDILGELGYLAGIHRTVSARAVGATTVGIIDHSFLDKEYNRLSGSLRTILKNLVLRFEKSIESTTDPRLCRKSPRIPKVLALSFKSKVGFIKAFSEDISTGGMFIKTTKPLAAGEMFILKLKLPDASETFKIDCEVSWNKTETSDPVKQPLGMGIKFIKISPKDHHRLKKELIKSETKK